MPGLRPDQVQEIRGLIHQKQIIQAIKVYREATGVGLAEAKDTIEEMANDEFSKPASGVQDLGNPILESRIESLLAERRKIEAVKVYREEYGVGLKDAKEAVDRIEMGMKRSGSSMNMPYGFAIGQDPFVERSSSGQPMLIILAAAIAVLVCGVGVFFLLMNL